MRLITDFQLLSALLLLTLTLQASEAKGQNTFETKDPYAKGFLVYSELLLATIKKQMNRLKEECREKNVIPKDNCIARKENREKEIHKISEAKESLQMQIDRLRNVLDVQRKDKAAIKESLENPFDCADIQLLKSRESGIYKIRPDRSGEEVGVFCDLDQRKNGGGWTTFLNRQVLMTPINFNRTWKEYKEGFGDKGSEYWLGNDLLHSLTTSGGSPSALRVDAEDFQGNTRWAEWNIFSVDDEDHKYRLTLKKYHKMSTLGDNLSINNGCSFTTLDADNDNSHVM